MKLNCLVTDDEPIAIGIVEDYIKTVPGLSLLGHCHDAMEAFALLRKETVDVLFIDIQMPGITGLDFIRSLKNPPLVVFTTAYPNYAIEGFELDAVDYLLKPISIDRFLRTADKLFARAAALKNSPVHTEVSVESDRKSYFFIKSKTDFVKINYSEIQHIEGLENYVKIVCDTKTVLSLTTMKYIESLLPADKFLRIHRSYIVNIDRVEKVQENSFVIKDKSLVIGKSYRKGVFGFLRQYYISQ